MTMQLSAISDHRSAPAAESPLERGGAPRRGVSSSTFDSRPSTAASRRAFTLLELLTVVAVIGILAAIIFPSIGAARKSANRAKTKVQFSQWAAAIESFRSEYGYYPTFNGSDLVNGGASPTANGDHLFHDILAGKKRNGDAAGSAAAAQNRKRIAFYTFSDSELTPSTVDNPYLIRNAFDGLSIAVVVDRNLDGKIDAADCNSGGFPGVATADGTLITPTSGPVSADIPSGFVRAGVIFYCADPNATASDPQFIFSWK